jgi:hypothetical protein
MWTEMKMSTVTMSHKVTPKPLFTSLSFSVTKCLFYFAKFQFYCIESLVWRELKHFSRHRRDKSLSFSVALLLCVLILCDIFSEMAS